MFKSAVRKDCRVAELLLEPELPSELAALLSLLVPLELEPLAAWMLLTRLLKSLCNLLTVLSLLLELLLIEEISCCSLLSIEPYADAALLALVLEVSLVLVLSELLL